MTSQNETQGPALFRSGRDAPDPMEGGPPCPPRRGCNPALQAPVAAGSGRNRHQPSLQAFFEKFERFADGPNAVAKMRELVLELAVQGD